MGQGPLNTTQKYISRLRFQNPLIIKSDCTFIWSLFLRLTPYNADNNAETGGDKTCRVPGSAQASLASAKKLSGGPSAAPGRGGVSFGEHDVRGVDLVVARTAPASEDGVQLGGVKRPCVLTVRIAHEPAETSGAFEEPGRRQAATRLADGERRDERAVRCRVLLHQELQGFRHPMDGMGRQDLKSLCQLLVGDGDLALRDILEECAHPCMRRQPIALFQSSRSGMVTSSRRRS